jgi:hypothetical protein
MDEIREADAIHREAFQKFVLLEARQPSSTGCATHEPFAIRQSGNIGQEILDQGGTIIAWTTDVWAAQVICKLLNEHEELLTI